MVDNFEILKSHLTFEDKFDRYIIHVIKRAKDDEGVRKYGASDKNRLLKTFYISSMQYLNDKIPVIKDLCESNKARAYILPQVRNNSQCLRNLLKVVVDNLDCPEIKPDHLIRTAYCAEHASRDKKWILDLDKDNMIEYVVENHGTSVAKKKWTPKQVLDFVQKKLVEAGRFKEDAYLIPTKNGHAIVTSPFDLQKSFKECNMFCQGEAKMQTDYVWSGPGEGTPKFSKLNGWLIKDGMALLYCV